MKRFLIKTFLVSLPILAGLLYFYFAFWYKSPQSFRDLGRLGMFDTDSSYTNCVDSLKDNLVNEVNFNSEIKRETPYILTIGDSFSQQGTKGYQNYMAHTSDCLSIYNLKRSKWAKHSPEEGFLICLQGDSLPNIVIIESVERGFINRLVGLNFSSEHKFIEKKDTEKANKSFLAWAQEYYKKNLGIDNPVYQAKLSKKMFTCINHEDDLFFINEDLQFPSSTNIKIAQEKLDSLFKIAKNHGIELYYLVAVDKYDAYQNYIVDNVYGEKTTLDEFAEKFKDNPHFINSKELIKPYLEEGEKDMFYCDDTHWSTKSAKIVGEEILKRMNFDKEINQDKTQK